MSAVPMPVVLWTDALFLALLAVVAGYVVYVGRHEHLRAPWAKVARRPIAMACAIVLSVFLAVAVLDSLHFHPPLGGPQEGYSTEVLSAFDVLVTPLRRQVEKTYSAPLAAHLYAKESIELPDGRQVRDYPRLRYGGAHLADPASERVADVRARTLRGLLKGAFLSVLLCVLTVLAVARARAQPPMATMRAMLAGGLELPWRSILASAGVLLVAATCVTELAAKYHVLGTDKVGQDVLYQALKSVRTGLLIGTLTTLVMLPFAVVLGIAAGYFRGWVDDVIQYLYTTLNSIPSVLLIAAAILMTQVYLATHDGGQASVTERADLRLLFLCMILGVTSWTTLCRLLRGEVLKLRTVDYIEAAVVFGVGHRRIIFRHILPNVMHIVLIIVVLDFSALVLAEAVLAYISIGVDPATASWGNMINSARLELAREPVVWWSLGAALAFMFALVLAANLFADAVRDAFDPRLIQP